MEPQADMEKAPATPDGAAEGQRYTPDQVLEFLWSRYMWKCSDDFSAEAEEFGNTRLIDYDDWLLAVFSFRGAFMGFFEGLENSFGFKAPRTEWLPLAKKRTTMRQIAEFIAARATHREIKPLRILGRECLEAGMFEVLVDDVRRITGRNARIGPSTPIRDVTDRDQRDRLVSRLMCQYPDAYRLRSLLAESRLHSLLGKCFLGLLCLTFGGAALVAAPAWIPGQIAWVLLGGYVTMLGIVLLVVFILLCVASSVHAALTRSRGPFHQDIRTFRDLVKALKNGLARPTPRADGEA